MKEDEVTILMRARESLVDGQEDLEEVIGDKKCATTLRTKLVSIHMSLTDAVRYIDEVT